MSWAMALPGINSSVEVHRRIVHHFTGVNVGIPGLSEHNLERSVFVWRLCMLFCYVCMASALHLSGAFWSSSHGPVQLPWREACWSWNTATRGFSNITAVFSLDSTTLGRLAATRSPYEYITALLQHFLIIQYSCVISSTKHQFFPLGATTAHLQPTLSFVSICFGL